MFFHPPLLPDLPSLSNRLGFCLHRNPNRTPTLQSAITFAYELKIRQNLNFRRREKKFASIRPRLSWILVNLEFWNLAQKIVVQNSEVYAEFSIGHILYLYDLKFCGVTILVRQKEKKYLKNKNKKNKKLISTSASNSRRAPLSPIFVVVAATVQVCFASDFSAIYHLHTWSFIVSTTFLGHV